MELTFNYCFQRTIQLLGRNGYHQEGLTLKAMLYEEDTLSCVQDKVLKRMIFLLCNLIADLKEKSMSTKLNQIVHARVLLIVVLNS